MKITQEMRGQIDSAAKNNRNNIDGRQSFDGVMESHTQKLKQQELQQLMKDITLQGDRLARFRSFRDLVKFKRMVKSFLQETVYSGLHLQKSHSFEASQSRKLTIVKKVDEKLIELTEEMMSQEKKTVDLLGIIGEIKGLLINLYR
ncbi:DUF327 family protein [Virgibacillus dakarensis]|uniref:DUF327 domain-containing protein n=1 Tax=Lentibacillus populi TaxID=1827502 RepID=A0A9W5TZW7_9BACI|nr:MULTISPECIES: YaaR family protein [Bacillaceae]MBT2215795.1 DUF327 family protein [Virgibacillus dakarensis]MTW86496.1 DUF327 family protein [Virgibacillus dakarensis]GGB50982.1 hypothetical protein GCM10011409_30650 [Lentibacillus populi]